MNKHKSTFNFISLLFVLEFANALVNPINYLSSIAKKEEMLKSLSDENDVMSF